MKLAKDGHTIYFCSLKNHKAHLAIRENRIWAKYCAMNRHHERCRQNKFRPALVDSKGHSYKAQTEFSRQWIGGVNGQRHIQWLYNPTQIPTSVNLVFRTLKCVYKKRKKQICQDCLRYMSNMYLFVSLCQTSVQLHVSRHSILDTRFSVCRSVFLYILPCVMLVYWKKGGILNFYNSSGLLKIFFTIFIYLCYYWIQKLA